MAPLTSQARDEAFAEIMQLISNERWDTNLLKPEIRAMVDAVDDSIDPMLSGILFVLPENVASQLASPQVLRFLSIFIRRRLEAAVLAEQEAQQNEVSP